MKIQRWRPLSFQSFLNWTNLKGWKQGWQPRSFQLFNRSALWIFVWFVACLEISRSCICKPASLAKCLVKGNQASKLLPVPKKQRRLLRVRVQPRRLCLKVGAALSWSGIGCEGLSYFCRLRLLPFFGFKILMIYHWFRQQKVNDHQSLHKYFEHKFADEVCLFFCGFQASLEK